MRRQTFLIKILLLQLLILNTGFSQVILMNPFKVPANREKTFLVKWKKVAHYLSKQPGFVSSTLHKAVGSNKKTSLWFNYAVWNTPQEFKKAVSSEEFKRLTKNFPAQGRPALYKKVETVKPTLDHRR